MSSRRSSFRGWSWGFWDQLLLSFSGVAVAILGLFAFSGSALGAFSTVVALGQFALAINRGITGEAHLVLHGDADGGLTVRAGMYLSLGVGVACAPFILGLSVFTDLPTEPAVVMAVLLPFVLSGDFLRYVLIARERSGVALAIDAATLLVQVVSVGLAYSFYASVSGLVSAWLTPYAVAGVGALIYATRTVERVPAGKSLGVARRYLTAYAYEAILGAASNYAALVGVLAFASLAATGIYRSILSIFGLTSLITNLLRTVVLAHLSRRYKGLPLPVRRLSLMLVGVITVASVAYASAVVGVLAVLGDRLMGSTAAALGALVLPAAVNRWMAAITAVPTVLGRLLRLRWESARVKIGVGLVSVVLAPLGAHFGGAAGALWAGTSASVVMALLLWMTVTSARRRDGAVEKAPSFHH